MSTRAFTLVLSFAVALTLAPRTANAHCDGLDGPVVAAARKSLDSGDVAYALMWVRESDEPEVRAAFEKTRAVRALGADARSLADMYFFETLVRVHRAGEGAPYTGLKPAGHDIGPAIPAADAALTAGAPDALMLILRLAVDHGVRRHFDEVLHAKRDAREGNVADGRRFVAAYVAYVHYVERLYQAIVAEPAGHAPERVHGTRNGGGHD